MKALSDLLTRCEYDLERKKSLEDESARIFEELKELSVLQDNLIESQRLLSSINEENTLKTLSFITGVINKALAQIFQGDGRVVELEKSLYNNRYGHINVRLRTPSGTLRDLNLQTGQGVKEVISFLFVVCLIAVRGGRRLLIMDELLSGLHRESKEVIANLMKVFTEEGFQFIMVEYGLDDIGQIVNVEQRDGVSTVVQVDEYKPVRYLS